MPVIRIKNGPLKGSVYNLEQESITIGRDDGIGIQILDQGVSRRHAEMFRIGEMYFVRDLDSRNGTFVNEDKISEELLRAGDEVKIGTTILRFEDRPATEEEHSPRDTPRAPSGPHGAVEDLEVTTTTIRIDLADELADIGSLNSHESRDLQLLYKVAKTVASERDVAPLAQKVIKLTATAVGAEHAYAFIKKPGHNEVTLIASWEKDGSDHDDGETSRETPTVSKGIIKRVLQFGRAVMTSDASTDERFKAQASVVIRNIRSVIVAPLVAMDQLLGVIYVSSSRLSDAFSSDDLELVTAIGIQAGMAIQGITLAQAQEKGYLAVVRSLVAAIEMRDPEARGHSERVSAFASGIARVLGLAKADNRRLQLAALLHNLGDLLLTPEDEKLDSAEKQRRRLAQAEKLIKRMSGKQWLIPPIKYHCERWDGKGIPDGLQGEDIPLPARIIAVARGFETAVSHGIETGEELEARQALEKIEASAGSLYDPRVVAALRDAFERGKLFPK